MAKPTISLPLFIAAAAAKDGRYAIAHALLKIADAHAAIATEMITLNDNVEALVAALRLRPGVVATEPTATPVLHPGDTP